ncbi:DUF1514 domain-containing protein [Staphylococcus edaphicus]|uniref:DUF1514 domain-containing protein n=1 Tax=Staphylococcus edaphicus TaxID=1955013 RepID=A0ABY4Q9K5_9STAP|nr:DUF1514 domain-containing protein [Staphylococcus edaphicus]UQW80695.1 DUF1514 domain-containing protein [Staphylococcus edaphicus]
MWIAIAFILAIIALITLITNSIKDDEIKKLQLKLGYVEGIIEGNKRYKQ